MVLPMNRPHPRTVGVVVSKLFYRIICKGIRYILKFFIAKMLIHKLASEGAHAINFGKEIIMIEVKIVFLCCKLTWAPESEETPSFVVPVGSFYVIVVDP